MKATPVAAAASAASTVTSKVSPPKVPTDPGKLAVNMTLISAAALLIYAGYKGGSIIDVFNGLQASQGPDSNPANITNPGVYTPAEAAVTGAETGAAVSKAITKEPTSSNGTTMMDGKPVANWIYPILVWAKANGWTGRVNSGYRTPQEQMKAARNYGLQHYGKGGPLGSNHVRKVYPGGAVDVSQPEELNRVLKKYKGVRRLIWAGPIIGDTVHFSATGH